MADYNEDYQEDEMPTGSKGGQTTDEGKNSDEFTDTEESGGGM